MSEKLLIEVDVTANEGSLAIGKLRAEIDALTKTIRENSKEVQKAKFDDTEKAKLLGAELALLKDKRSALIELQKQEKQGSVIDPTSIIAQRKELNLLTQQYYALSKAELENANVGGILKGKINELYVSVSKAEQGVGNFKRAVGQYNTAGMAMSQVLREIPAFTFSAQTGFLALSNNLPILGDEMKKIANSIDNVTQKRRGWSAAFLEMGKNILSFGGAMTILIGLLPMVIPYIQELITGSKELTDDQKKLNEQLKDNEKSIYNNANAYKVFQGEITESQAKFLDLSFEMNKGLIEIEKATETKIKSINGFWNTLWTNILGGYGVIKGETIRYIEETKARAQGEMAEQALVQKYINSANSSAIGMANEYRNKLRMIHIEAIKDEVTREKARINELRRIEKEKVQIEFTTQEIYDETIKAIDKVFDAQIANVKAKTKKSNQEKIQDEKDYQKELLALIEQYHEQIIQNETDSQTKRILSEKERHHKVIDELKTEKGDTEAIIKQKNKNIEEEEKRHQTEMLKILLTAEQAKEDKTAIDEAKRFEDANILLEIKANERIKKESEKTKKEKEKNDELNQKILNASIEAEKTTVDAISKIKSDAIDRDLKRELKSIQRAADGENAILENKLRNGLITEGQYNDEKAALDKKTQEQEDIANREAFEKDKKLKIATAKILYALEISQLAYSASQNPANGTTMGMAGVTQFALTGGVATARYLANVQTIAASEYGQGGKVEGRSHAQGGIDINVEGGEGMVNKKSMRSNQVMSVIGTPSQITSAVNASGGGVSWESGATLQPIQRNSFSQSTMTKSDFQSMFATLGKMINDKEVYLSEYKVTKAQKNVKTYEKSSRF